MDFRDEYRRKLISPEAAAGLVKSGMWIDYGYALGFPRLIDETLAGRAGELQQVKVRAALADGEPLILKADPNQEHFIYNSSHFSGPERRYHDKGICSHLPTSLGEIPRMYREWLKDEVDIAFIQVTPMDRHGYFNFGATVGYQKAICDVAKTVVLEVNESQPWLCGGYDEVIHISQVDHIVENKKYPISELPPAAVTRADEMIAGYVAERVEDASTIELGIGGMPNTVGNLLIKHGLKDLGIHTGTMTESMLDLIEAGVVTGRKKTINPGKVVTQSVHGSRRLFDFVDRNPMIAGFSCEYTHNLNIIAQNRKQVCINSTLRVDLKGQVCSESLGTRQISGTGGALDWVRGANASPGGRAFTCLYSTYRDREGKLRSNIVPTLEPGDMVTIPATDISYVVTEFGAVDLKGKATWQRAKLLISIAHPDFRAELEEAARRINVITRGTAGLSAG